jgi:predicted nucleic acid-binding protein
MVGGAEVEREPGPDNDLIASTVTVIWTETSVTMVRRASRSEEGWENALKLLEETVEACSIVMVQNTEYFEGWNLLVQWAQVGFGEFVMITYDQCRIVIRT